MAKNEKSGGNTSDVKVDNVRTESFWYKIAKSGKNESSVHESCYEHTKEKDPKVTTTVFIVESSKSGRCLGKLLM